MKLRYYLRGLGIGIVVTALVMGLTTKADERPLTDAEIRAMALKLGMVDADSRSLADVSGLAGAQASPTPTDSPSSTNSPLSTDSPSPTDLNISEPSEDSGSPAPEVTETPSPSPTPIETEEPVVETETVTIVIVRGDSSYTVSRRLQEAGLIDDAGAYDTYLVDNGYSKTIRTGTYRIPVDASWEEIAEIIA